MHDLAAGDIHMKKGLLNLFWRHEFGSGDIYENWS